LSFSVGFKGTSPAAERAVPNDMKLQLGMDIQLSDGNSDQMTK
jgi:hypothetical protein